MNEPPNKLQRRRGLRRRSTKAETLLWSALRNRNIADLKFRRQHPIGPWIGDFVCVESLLVIELDGGYHEHTQDEDRMREKAIAAEGFQVLRFTNEEVLGNLEGVVTSIRRFLGLPEE